MTNDTIGVDISKAHLDTYRMSDGESRRFANDKAGHEAFISWFGVSGARIVYEPTGPYRQAFERRLTDTGAALVKVDPRQARRFAERCSTSKRGRCVVRPFATSRTCTWPARRW